MKTATAEQLVAGTKLDEGKPRFDLIPPHSLTELARTFAVGAQKYADRNWEKGMEYGRIYAATQRHLTSFWGGEEFDPETGLPHLAQAMFGCSVLLEYRRTGIGADNRTKLVALSAPAAANTMQLVAPKKK